MISSTSDVYPFSFSIPAGIVEIVAAGLQEPAGLCYVFGADKVTHNPQRGPFWPSGRRDFGIGWTGTVSSYSLMWF